MSVNLKINIVLVALAIVFTGYYRFFTVMAMVVAVVFFVASNWYYAWKYTRQSFDMNAIYAIESISALRNSEKIPCPDWLKFPDYERVNWLNHVIKIMWDPSLKEAIEEVMDGCLEKLVDENKPRYLSGLKYKNIDLGKTPPMIIAVKVYDAHKKMAASKAKKNKKPADEDPYCYLDVRAILSGGSPKIFFGSKNNKRIVIEKIQIKATLRLKFCNFVNSLPGFSRLEFSLVENPSINFSLSAWKLTISSLPGIKAWLNKFFRQDIFSACMYPKFAPLEFQTEHLDWLRANGRLQFYGQPLSFRWVLKVYLHSVVMHSPPNSELVSYCIFKTQNYLLSTEVFESKNRKSVLTFNRRFVFNDLAPGNVVQIFVMNQQGNSVDKVLGQAFIDLQKEVDAKTEGNIKLDLIDVSTGHKIGFVNVDFNYLIPSTMEKKTQTSIEKRQKQPSKKTQLNVRKEVNVMHIVNVNVIQADGLPELQKTRFSEVQAFVLLEGLCVRTKKMPFSTNPKWNTRFEIEIPFKHTKVINVLIYRIYSKIKSHFLGKAKIKFLDNDGLFLLEDKENWYPIEVDEDNDPSKSSNSRVQLEIHSRIFNLSQQKKTFTAKKMRDEEVEYSVIEKEAAEGSEVLTVELREARNLVLLNPAGDEHNFFATIRVNNETTKKTRTIENSESPIWNESFNFTPKKSHVGIEVSVFQKTEHGVSNIGMAQLTIGDIAKLNLSKSWYCLEPKNYYQPKETNAVTEGVFLSEKRRVSAYRSSSSISKKGARPTSQTAFEEIGDSKMFEDQELDSAERDDFSDKYHSDSIERSVETRQKRAADSDLDNETVEENELESDSDNDLRPQILIFASVGARVAPRKMKSGLAKMLKETKFNSIASEMKNNLRSSLMSRKRFTTVLMLKDMRKDLSEIYEANVEVKRNSLSWNKKKGLINFKSRFPIDEKTCLSRPRDDTVILKSGKKSVQLTGPQEKIEEFVAEISKAF